MLTQPYLLQVKSIKEQVYPSCIVNALSTGTYFSSNFPTRIAKMVFFYKNKINTWKKNMYLHTTTNSKEEIQLKHRTKLSLQIYRDFSCTGPFYT